MTKSDELVKRLRDRGVCSLAHNSCRNDIVCEQAAARIEELEAKQARAEKTIEALESLRPVWAQGWSNDSMAAQASTNALTQLWEMLGVQDQTQAVAALAELKGETDGC